MNKEKIFQMFSLEGKVAIITGGAGMLGTEYSKTLTAAGAIVMALDKNEPKKEIANVAHFLCDITNENNVRSVISEIARDFGQIDILINNAASTDFEGFTSSQRFAHYEDFPMEVWEKEIAVSLTGTYLVTRETIRQMRKVKQGVIINISSTHGLVAPDNSIYGKEKYKAITYPVTKSALLGFTRAMASYLGQYGIRVNCLCPGGVDVGYLDDEFRKNYSRGTILGRMAKKDEYNGAILFLCSDASSYMTGSIMVVDGGWTAW